LLNKLAVRTFRRKSLFRPDAWQFFFGLSAAQVKTSKKLKFICNNNVNFLIIALLFVKC